MIRSARSAGVLHSRTDAYIGWKPTLRPIEACTASGPQASRPTATAPNTKARCAGAQRGGQDIGTRMSGP